METQMDSTSSPRASVKDFFINLGAIVALYTGVVSLLNLLFTIINTAYPKIINGYNYFGSQSISWPVATLIIFFPIFILLMWLLEREYRTNPEKQSSGVHKWLTYITLFIAGLTIAIDLITVLYYFIDGQELTIGFLLKVLVILIITSCIFIYYISDIRGKLTQRSRIFWRIIAGVIVIGSIVLGFSVLGSPRTQQLLKYDEQKVNDLQNINSQVMSYFSMKNALPQTLKELSSLNYYIPQVDSQTQKPYEYEKTGIVAYSLCAEFNKSSTDQSRLIPVIAYPYGGITSWAHGVGRYCFAQNINPATPVPKF